MVLWLVVATVVLTSVSLCELRSEVLVYLMIMYVFFSSHSWHALHPYTKFTNQQCCVLKSVGTLLILMGAAIQVVYYHYMLTFFMECLWYVCQILTPLFEATR